MMLIDVISDVVCPWCYLGKRRLDLALTALPQIEAEVVYRPFFLDANIPPQGYDRAEYMTEKFGAERLKTLHEPLEKAGERDGVLYRFDLIKREPNSLDAHRLIRWALQAGKQAAVVDALFKAYWSEGRDISDHEVLADVATDCGMNGAEIKTLLQQDTDKRATLLEAERAHQMGVTGVPTFIFAQKYGVSGAQETDALIETIRKVASQQPA